MATLTQARTSASATRRATSRLPRPAKVAADEWRARVELAACYRIFAHLGWTELIYNHITLRLPGSEKRFLINPFGLLYTEVRASNLVKIDLAGCLNDVATQLDADRTSCAQDAADCNSSCVE